MSRLLVHLVTPTGTIQAGEVDGIVIGAEVAITRLSSPTLPRLESAVVNRIKADVPVSDQPGTIATADDASSGDVETAYNVLWCERQSSEALAKADGLGTAWPEVREVVVLWVRTHRGNADAAFDWVRSAINALIQIPSDEEL